MKLRTKLILSPIVLVLLLLAVLQVVLLWGLTGIVRKHALPPAEKALGATITLDSAGLNLLAGSLAADGITISNPRAFDEPSVFAIEHVFADVALRSLLEQIADVSILNIEGAALTIARNADGQVNLAEWRKEMQAQSVTPDQAPTPVQPDESSVPASDAAVPQTLPKARIQSLGIDLLVQYIDHKRDDGPLQFGLAMRITANDIITYPAPDAEWGQLRLSGHLADDPQSFIIDLQGTVAPLLNPLYPSFNLNGNVASLDMEQFREFTEEIDITAERASMDVTLVCRDGIFVQDRSTFSLKLTNAQLVGETARKNNFNGVLASLTIALPVGGTIDRPSIDWQAALTHTLTENIKNNPELILKALDIDKGKVDKEIDKGMKKLGGFLDSLGG